MIEAVFNFIIELFQDTGLPYLIATWMLLVAALIWSYALFRWFVERGNLLKRFSQLKASLGDFDDVHGARENFADNYGEIDKVLSSKSYGSDSLVIAWEEFKETLIDESATPISNASRPQEFYRYAINGQTWLDFWANIAVGVGLLFTFLGLVAALKFANDGLASGDMESMQESLQKLLAASSAKFITSVVGVFISISLKISKFLFQKSIQKNMQSLCAKIEKGLLFTPPQAIAAKQEKHAEQQSELLKNLGTDIGLQFQQALKPISDTVIKAAETQSTAITDGISQVIQDTTGPELQKLAVALDNITVVMEGLEEKLKNSGDNAADQISQAADVLKGALDDLPQQLSQASLEAAEDLRSAGQTAAEAFTTSQEAFESAANQINSLQPTLERWEVSTNSAVDNISEALSGFKGNLVALNGVSRLLSTAGESLSAQLSQSETRIQSAAEASEAALEQARELHEAISDTQSELSSAWENYSERFEDVDKVFAGVVTELSNSLDVFKEKIGEQVSSVDSQLGRAVSNLAEGVSDLRDIVEEISENS